MDDNAPPAGIPDADWAATPPNVGAFIRTCLLTIRLQQEQIAQLQQSNAALLVAGSRRCDAPEGMCQELLAHEVALWTFVREVGGRADQQRC
jgi:hypothetical protein